ncbi:MAG TPA: hypothetical protein VFD92_05035 [Candidatus Binatia bacterium]|nr:hypothetical protein [Candidatus Binatia bacterium]
MIAHQRAPSFVDRSAGDLNVNDQSNSDRRARAPESAPPSGYERPRVESVLTADDLDREATYAGVSVE